MRLRVKKCEVHCTKFQKPSRVLNLQFRHPEVVFSADADGFWFQLLAWAVLFWAAQRCLAKMRCAILRSSWTCNSLSRAPLVLSLLSSPVSPKRSGRVDDVIGAPWH